MSASAQGFAAGPDVQVRPSAATVPQQRGSAEQSARASGAARLPSLTGLRWVAAGLVFGYHLNVIEYFGPGPGRSVVNVLFAPGAVGVSFFFILSGFVLMWSAPPSRAVVFWRRRFARVYPLHVVTAVTALIFLLVHAPQTLPTPSAAFANLTLTHAWVRDVSYYQSLNTVSWTLSCEAFFYLVFPLLCVAVVRLRARGAAALAAAALAVTMLGPLVGGLVAGRQSVDWVFHWFPAARFPEFVLGVALARLVSVAHVRLARHAGRLWTGAIVLTVAGYAVIRFAPSSLRHAACTAAGFALVLVAASVSDLHGGRLIFQRRTFVKLGEISFAFYLVHLLVVRVLEAVVGFHPNLDYPAAIGLTALTFGLSLLLSWLLYERVERPCHRWLLA